MPAILDDLLKLPAADRAAALAKLSDADVVAMADRRSMKKVRTRRQALKVIEAEAELYATFATAGTH